MKSFTSKEIIAVLVAHGFELSRIKGRHHVFVNPGTGKRTVVPMHGKELKKARYTASFVRQVST